jgi:hypothetical protein
MIAVEGCEDHHDRWKSQQDTWAYTSDVVVAYFDGPMLHIPDDYKSLPAKTKAICNFARRWDFLFKVDTDTYVSIDRLLKSGFEQYDYSGFELNQIEGHPYASGPHYWLSNKAINFLADANWSNFTEGVRGYEDCEDVMVGEILRCCGVTLHHDIRYSPFIPVLPDNDVISHHLSTLQPFKTELMYAAHKKAQGL